MKQCRTTVYRQYLATVYIRSLDTLRDVVYRCVQGLIDKICSMSAKYAKYFYLTSFYERKLFRLFVAKQIFSLALSGIEIYLSIKLLLNHILFLYTFNSNFSSNSEFTNKMKSIKPSKSETFLCNNLGFLRMIFK